MTSAGLSLSCYGYSSVGGQTQQGTGMVHLKCDLRFSEACPCLEGCGKLWPGTGMLMVLVSMRSVCALGWFCGAVVLSCEGLGGVFYGTPNPKDFLFSVSYS